MNNNAFTICAITDNANHFFDDMMSCISDNSIEFIYLKSLDQLFQGDVLNMVKMVIISTDALNSNEIENLAKNREKIFIPVVVAGNLMNYEYEMKLRLAGVSCFLMLPEETDMVAGYIEAVRRCE